MEIISSILGVIGLLGSITSMVVSFFKWVVDNNIQLGKTQAEANARSIAFVICSLIVPILGGILWTYACKIFGWPYYLGGVGNEPKNFHAFAWGFITVLPLALLAFIATSTRIIKNYLDLLKWLISRDALKVVAFSVFAGLGAMLFYNLNFRAKICCSISTEAYCELLIIVIWCGLISFFSIFPIILFQLWQKKKMNIFSISAILFSIFLGLCALVIYYYLYNPGLDPNRQVKGIAAGYALRFALLCGLLLALDNTIYYKFRDQILKFLNKPISEKK